MNCLWCMRLIVFPLVFLFIFFLSSPLSAQIPPLIQSISPGEMNGLATEIGAVSVTFINPVVGLKAKDLKVNGSAATAVSGRGKGPYVFSGYLFPLPGIIKITLSPGDIRDLQSGVPFAGNSWTIHLFSPDKDEDREGLSNLHEIQAGSDSLLPDSDHDGMNDLFEFTHPCLKIASPDAAADGDQDGISNQMEQQKGTDPCRS